ncbi:hypothetical protein D7Y05_12140 [bacterium 1XD42-54]|jgi:hypothetical protein|nr:hypothetical protein D7Y05_12140 [bacterium 1XD42-54]
MEDAEMGFHTVIEGNAFYEVDDDCLRKRRKENDTAAKDMLKGNANQRTDQGMSPKIGGNGRNRSFR